MGKLLLILLLVILVGCWITRLRAPAPPREGRGSARGPQEPRPNGAARQPQEIVACAHCGLHLPRAEAIEGPGGGVYCSEAHRLAHGDRG